MHYLITQIHAEDGTIEQNIYEASTWQEAFGMAQLGWAIESGVVTLAAAEEQCRENGTMVVVGVVESYVDYHGATKIQLKEAV